MERTYWYDNEVEYTPRADASVPQDGRVKEAGTPVRRCDGCTTWKLMEEFPLKHKHPEFCYICHDLPKPVKKPKKGDGFSRYNEYVMKCLEFKAELQQLRSEYQATLRRLKIEEDVVRRDYTNQRNELLARKQEHEDAYREKCR